MMAKVQQPFMSMNATGTIGGVLTSKKVNGVCTIRKKIGPHPCTSIPQQKEQARMRAARTAYNALSTEDLTLWGYLATKRRLSKWAAFWGEYQNQRVQAPAAPLIPSTWL
jgi:hypothetical protein